jgi:hypothetical protein
MAHPTGTKVRTAVQVPTKSLSLVPEIDEVVVDDGVRDGAVVVAVDSATDPLPLEQPVRTTATTLSASKKLRPRPRHIPPIPPIWLIAGSP